MAAAPRDAPDSQKKLAGQGMHAVWPLAFWKRPAAHLAHLAVPEPAATVPRLHGRQSSEDAAPPCE